jgi:hypothetical protein
MRTRRLKDLDRIILQHCERESVLLQDLLKHVPQGTLYRHVSNLLAAGLLAKRGRTYCTTDQGKRRLAEWTSQFDWNIFDRIFPPMRYVPTPQHRAVIELVTAAVVARNADVKEDHHPSFLIMGSTLAWKTSLAKFESLLLGLAPAETIIDLTTESGRSLLVRRDGKGGITFKRDAIDGQLIVFDDYLEAEASMRASVHHFLSGRTVVPLDNTILRIKSVAVLTLNPRPKTILEEQTSFSTAQLRRLVVTNLANVALPDLANMGHQALEAAAKHGPLLLQPPTFDAEAWRPHIVSLVREIIMPQIWPRIDTEMIITMTTGMTGFIPDPERAIQQTVYDYGITAETLGWTMSEWSQAVIRFSLHKPLSRRQPEKQEPILNQEDQEHIILWRYAMEHNQDSSLPPFAISDRNRARLLAIAIQENIPIERADHALDVILDSWEQRQRDGHSLDEAYSALQLAKHLGQRSISIQDVKLGMRLRRDIHAGAYTEEELQAALDLVPVFREQGLTAHDDRLEPVLAVAVRLLNSDRSLAELDEWLQSHPNDCSQGNEAPDYPGLDDKK